MLLRWFLLAFALIFGSTGSAQEPIRFARTPESSRAASSTAKDAEPVAKLTDGTIGSIHVPNMEEDGLEAFVGPVYANKFEKESLVFDIRYNRGGPTHAQVLIDLGPTRSATRSCPAWSSSRDWANSGAHQLRQAV